MVIFQRFDAKGNADALQKYIKTMGILILFVIAYMAQWWPLVAFSIWSYFGVPHIGLVEVGDLYITKLKCLE